MKILVLTVTVLVTAVLQSQGYAQEGEKIKAQDTLHGTVYVCLSSDQNQKAIAKEALKIHCNALSLAINEQGITKASVAVREGGRVLLRSSENVSGTAVVLATRYNSQKRNAPNNEQWASR